MIATKDIIREGNPTLRVMAEEVSVPIIEEDRQLNEGMLTFLKNSQDPVRAGELQLRGGVGLTIPQLDTSKRIIAVHVPGDDPESETPSLGTVMHNPKALGHSVQDVCLGKGEDCSSVDRDVPEYVVHHSRVTVSYLDMIGEKHKVYLKGYEAIVIQHRIDHTDGIMFYDHINKGNPFASKEGILVIE